MYRKVAGRYFTRWRTVNIFFYPVSSSKTFSVAVGIKSPQRIADILVIIALCLDFASTAQSLSQI